MDLYPQWAPQEGGGHVHILISFYLIPTGKHVFCSQIAVSLRWGPRDGKGYVAISMAPYDGTQQGRVYVPVLFTSDLLLPRIQFSF